MIELQITGKCKACPFMELDLMDTIMHSGKDIVFKKRDVRCIHEDYCDREEKE